MKHHPLYRAPVLGLLHRTEPSQEAVLDELRRALVEGGAPPGSLLPVDEIAEAFGVSHIPVREALKILQGEGLVAHVPRQGYTVAKLSLAEFVELYAVRAALEEAALQQAVARATQADHLYATRVHHELGLALSADDSTTYHRVSRAFHLALVQPAGMRRLIHLLETTWNITEPAQPMTLVGRDRREQMHAEHARMLQAFVTGDNDTLLREATDHMGTLHDALLTIPPDHEVFATPET